MSALCKVCFFVLQGSKFVNFPFCGKNIEPVFVSLIKLFAHSRGFVARVGDVYFITEYIEICIYAFGL